MTPIKPLLDGLAEMIKSERLTASMIPDDYDWLVVTLGKSQDVKPLTFGHLYYLTRAVTLLAESLSKWEDEENSVQEEKADHIVDLRKFFTDWDKHKHDMSMPDDKTFSLRAEAATCLWEAMLEARSNFVLSDPHPIERHFNKYGTVEMRHVAINLADLCCETWSALSEDEQQCLIPYDWEFCPRFLSLVQWVNGPDRIYIAPTKTEAVAAMREIARREAKRVEWSKEVTS